MEDAGYMLLGIALGINFKLRANTVMMVITTMSEFQASLPRAVLEKLFFTGNLAVLSNDL